MLTKRDSAIQHILESAQTIVQCTGLDILRESERTYGNNGSDHFKICVRYALFGFIRRDFLVVDEGVVGSIVSLELYNKLWLIIGIFISPNSRGKLIGYKSDNLSLAKLFLLAYFRDCEAAGRHACLEVANFNKQAVEYYFRLGHIMSQAKEKQNLREMLPYEINLYSKLRGKNVDKIFDSDTEGKLVKWKGVPLHNNSYKWSLNRLFIFGSIKELSPAAVFLAKVRKLISFSLLLFHAGTYRVLIKKLANRIHT